MAFRITDLAGGWRAYTTRGRPGRVVDQSLLRYIYAVWIGAFTLKVIGAGWDVAWHFRFLRDDLAPPHMINTVGLLIGMALLFFHSWTGFAVDRRGLRVTQLGVALFLLAIPLDLLNHRIFGLDLTAWSATHALLYLGTAVMILGVGQSWLKLAQPGRARTIFGLAFGFFLLEDLLFPLGQQEYGTLALDAYLKGQPTASTELLARAGDGVMRLALGPIPLWVYPIYLIVVSTLVFASVRAAVPWRWAATTIAATYVAYRAIAYGILVATAFPPSFIPVMLLGGALAMDLAERRRWPSIVTAAVLTIIWYSSALLIGSLTLMPTFALSTAPFAFVLLWGALELIGQQKTRRVVQAKPA